MNPYMYLFIREDLSHPQQIVQAAHAVDEINKQHPHEPGNFMVLCGAKDEKQLHKIAEMLDSSQIKYSMFFEPDIDSFTAIATQPLRGEERKPLKRFQTKK